MKYPKNNSVSLMVLIMCLASGVQAATVGNSQFQASFTVNPFFQDEAFILGSLDGTAQTAGDCSFSAVKIAILVSSVFRLMDLAKILLPQ